MTQGWGGARLQLWPLKQVDQQPEVYSVPACLVAVKFSHHALALSAKSGPSARTRLVLRCRIQSKILTSGQVWRSLHSFMKGRKGSGRDAKAASMRARRLCCFCPSTNFQGLGLTARRCGQRTQRFAFWRKGHDGRYCDDLPLVFFPCAGEFALFRS